MLSRIAAATRPAASLLSLAAVCALPGESRTAAFSSPAAPTAAYRSAGRRCRHPRTAGADDPTAAAAASAGGGGFGGRSFSSSYAAAAAADGREAVESELRTEADAAESMSVESISRMELLSGRLAGAGAGADADAASSSRHASPLPLLLRTAEEVSSYVYENFDAVLFDCDGVVYRGSDVVPGAPDAIRGLMGAGKAVLFVTNNAASSRSELRDKLAWLTGFDGLTDEQMVGSSYSAARYLQKRLLGGEDGAGPGARRSRRRNVHVIGTEGLCREIRSAGFSVTGGPIEVGGGGHGMSRDELASYPFPEGGPDGVDAVVVGLDTDFSYRKLCVANVLLQRNPRALFVSTNEDAYDLVGADARHLPGNGALVRALEHSSGRRAVCVGKPSSVLAELIAEDHGLDPGRTLMVGDRLDTDVRFGIDGGMSGALVLTGCTTAERIVELAEGGQGGTTEEPLPSVIFPHMGMMSS